MMSARTFAALGAAVSARRERAFFAGSRLANGTFKTTVERRLDDLNRLVAEQWKSAGVTPRRLPDVGRGYFSSAQLRTAVSNLKDRLIGPNSFLSVNRTRKDGANDGTLCQFNAAARREALAILRDGREVEDIVLAA